MQNFMKTIINGVQKWAEKEINSSKSELNNRIDDSQADWYQNDTSADSYIKNRPFYEAHHTVLLFEDEFVFDELDGQAASNYYYNDECVNLYDYFATIGNSVLVEWNGKTYDLTIEDGRTIQNTLFSIYIVQDADGFYIIRPTKLTNDYETIQIKFLAKKLEVVKISNKFLPDNIATINDVQAVMDVANEAQATANSKMDATNPVGTGSFSINRKAGTTIGNYSHAEGYNTTSSGNYSHAEGYNTTSSGDYAHAEGYNTTSSGDYAHAEGYNTIANNAFMHVFGKYNTSDNQKYTTIYYGRQNFSILSSYYFADEYTFDSETGLFSLINPSQGYTSNDKERLVGKYTLKASNTPDTRIYKVVRDSDYGSGYALQIFVSKLSTQAEGKYAHVVGNGTSNTKRSNAHTLDWDGVGWFQGGLQVGGNAQDDGAKNVMLEGNAYDYFILNDVNTGTPYKIQIIDGNLVSSAMTIETEPTT